MFKVVKSIATVAAAAALLSGCITIKGSSASPAEARAEYQRTMTQIAMAQQVAARCDAYRFNAEAAKMLEGLAQDLAEREFVSAERRAALRAEGQMAASNAIALQDSLGDAGVCGEVPLWTRNGSIDPTLLVADPE